MDLSKASFTVEASLLMPFILGILILICMAATWLGDRDIAYFNTLAITDYALMQLNGGKEPESGEMEAYVAENKDNALIGAVDTSGKVENGIGTIAAEIKGHTNLPFMRWMSSLGWQSSEDIGAKNTVIYLRPVDVIRKYRLMGE